MIPIHKNETISFTVKLNPESVIEFDSVVFLHIHNNKIALSEVCVDGDGLYTQISPIEFDPDAYYKIKCTLTEDYIYITVQSDSEVWTVKSIYGGNKIGLGFKDIKRVF